MINVEKVTKYFDDFCALDEFSLKVESGSAYGLLGSNGAGKSTLLRILAGIYRQDSGDVTVDGEKIYDNVSVKQRVFYVSDDVEQYANMTPEDMRKMYEIFYPTFSNEKFARLMKAIDPAAEQAYVNIFKRHETAGGGRVRTCGIDRYTSAGRGF